jgi:hypothetical protein
MDGADGIIGHVGLGCRETFCYLHDVEIERGGASFKIKSQRGHRNSGETIDDVITTVLSTGLLDKGKITWSRCRDTKKLI